MSNSSVLDLELNSLVNKLSFDRNFRSQFGSSNDVAEFVEKFIYDYAPEDAYRRILPHAPLFYPSAKKWMWTYCIYLGPWTDTRDGSNYDLGIHINGELDGPAAISAAVVYGDNAGNYISGSLEIFVNKDVEEGSAEYGHYEETWKRAKLLGFIK